jgi:hypothetical protein
MTVIFGRGLGLPPYHRWRQNHCIEAAKTIGLTLHGLFGNGCQNRIGDNYGGQSPPKVEVAVGGFLWKSPFTTLP